MRADDPVVEHLVRTYGFALEPVATTRAYGAGTVSSEEHPRLRRFLAAYARKTGTHLSAVHASGEHRFEGSCPCPSHPDLDPSFWSKVNADGRFVAHCRSHPGGAMTGEFLELLGLPEEIGKSLEDFSARDVGWYRDIATSSDDAAEQSLEEWVKALRDAGLEPQRTHEAVMLYDFFCPRSQADEITDCDDEGALTEPKRFEVVRETDVPRCRIFLTTGGAVCLRCTCQTCKGSGMEANLRDALGWSPLVARSAAVASPTPAPHQPSTLAEAFANRLKNPSFY